MRVGRIEEADGLANRIGEDIIRCNTAHFKGSDDDNDARDMWTKVRQLATSANHCVTSTVVTAQILNSHYACLNLFAEPLTALFSMSLSVSFIPSQWRRAFIVPLPKIPNLVVSSDYQPISITSVLSRMLERLVVRQFIYPSILNPPSGLIFANQFAFRPTGSSTAALITILQRVTMLLESNPYVIVYALDLCKAFDTVRHSTLMDKMGRLSLPDYIYNWIAEFLGDQ